MAGDLNLNSTGLVLGRFWPIFLQNDKSQTFDVAVGGLDFAGDLNLNSTGLGLGRFWPIFL